MTGEKISPKEVALYDAVADFLNEGADMNKLTVAEIALRAGIGKGTVYEYFENKEELISRSILYNINTCSMEILTELKKIPLFYDKIYYLLGCLEENQEQHMGVLNMIHYMTGSSMVTKDIYQILNKEKRLSSLFGNIIDYLLEAARSEGLLYETAPEMFLHICLVSKAVTYGIYLMAHKADEEVCIEDMKEKICHSICAEIRGFINPLAGTDVPVGE